MITGDYHQTAVAVAWGVGMVPAGGVVHVIDKLPTTAMVSPPSSPVHISSARSLFPREWESNGMLSRRPLVAWSRLRPSLSEAELDPVNVSRDTLLAAPLLPESDGGSQQQVAAQDQAQQRSGGKLLARARTRLQITSSLDSQSAAAGLDSQGSEHFRLQCDDCGLFLGQEMFGRTAKRCEP